MMLRFKALFILLKEYHRIHPRHMKGLFDLWCKTWNLTTDEMARIADAVQRYGAENFYY